MNLYKNTKSIQKLVKLLLVGTIYLISSIVVNAQSLTTIAEQRVIDYQRIHLNVENLDASISAFQNVLGMELLRYRPLMNGEFLGTDPGSMLRTAGLRVPEGDFEIELIEWTGSTHVSEYRDFQDPGMLLFAFEVNNFDAKFDGLRRLGWEVISRGEQPYLDENQRSVILRDSNSFFVELIENVSNASVSDNQSMRSIMQVTFWMTVDDLSETANFYSNVFNFELPLEVAYQPLDEKKRHLFATSEATQYRTTRGLFPGLEFPAINFQEFKGPGKRAPLRHRVQDYGGPTIPIVVRENDLQQILVDMQDNGAIIGQEQSSAMLPQVVDGTWWIRDPNGILYQVEAPQ